MGWIGDLGFSILAGFDFGFVVVVDLSLSFDLSLDLIYQIQFFNFLFSFLFSELILSSHFFVISYPGLSERFSASPSELCLNQW